MELAEYMSAENFPRTSQSGLSAKQQLLIDAFNYDQLRELVEGGGQLDAQQQAIWNELQEKMKEHARLARETAGT